MLFILFNVILYFEISNSKFGYTKNLKNVVSKISTIWITISRNSFRKQICVLNKPLLLFPVSYSFGRS